MSTISLKKGQKIDLTKTNPGLKKCLLGLGWDVKKFSGPDFDLDASVFLLGANGKVRKDGDFIFYNNLVSDEGCVVHTGDNRTGDGDGDDEVIQVTLSTIPADVEKIAFTVTIHDAEVLNQNFGQVCNAYVRLVDEDTGQELIRYDLGEDFSTETAAVFAELYRHNGEWKFNAVGSGFEGGLAALARAYGLTV